MCQERRPSLQITVNLPPLMNDKTKAFELLKKTMLGKSHDTVVIKFDSGANLFKCYTQKGAEGKDITQ